MKFIHVRGSVLVAGIGAPSFLVYSVGSCPKTIWLLFFVAFCYRGVKRENFFCLMITTPSFCSSSAAGTFSGSGFSPEVSFGCSGGGAATFGAGFAGSSQPRVKLLLPPLKKTPVDGANCQEKPNYLGLDVISQMVCLEHPRCCWYFVEKSS